MFGAYALCTAVLISVPFTAGRSGTQDCRTVGNLERLSDCRNCRKAVGNCRTVGMEREHRGHRNHWRILSECCRTLSDCRTVGTVGLSDTVGHCRTATVGLSDWGSVSCIACSRPADTHCLIHLISLCTTGHRIFMQLIRLGMTGRLLYGKVYGA